MKNTKKATTQNVATTTNNVELLKNVDFKELKAIYKEKRQELKAQKQAKKELNKERSEQRKTLKARIKELREIRKTASLEIKSIKAQIKELSN